MDSPCGRLGINSVPSKPYIILKMNFGPLYILLIFLAKFVYSALTSLNEENENNAKPKNLANIDDSIILFIGSFLHCPQSYLGSVNKHFNQLFMRTFPLEKYMFMRFGSPPGLFDKNLNSRYIFLASKLNLALDESIPENVAGLLKMLGDQGKDRKLVLEFVTELFNNIERSFGYRAEEIRHWLNTPCGTNAAHQARGPLFAYFIFAGDRYNHDKNLLARIMLYTGIDSVNYFMLLFDSGTSRPFFQNIVNELARINLDTCLEIAQHYSVGFRISFWTAIAKHDLNGTFLSRIFEINVTNPNFLNYRNSIIFEVDETLLRIDEKVQVWERNNLIMNNYMIKNSGNIYDLHNFLNDWKFRPELVSEEQINSCLSLPSDYFLLLQLARTIVRKQRLELLVSCLEMVRVRDEFFMTDFELQTLISSNYAASVMVSPMISSCNFFLNLKIAEKPLEILLSERNVSNLYELIDISQAEDKVKFAITYSDNPLILLQVFEEINSFDVISAVKDVFKYHSVSKHLYDWIRIISDKANGILFEGENHQLIIEDVDVSSFFKILSDENLTNSVLFSAFNFYFMDSMFLLKQACRLDSFTRIVIQNPNLVQYLNLSSNYDLLICQDENEIKRLMEIYFALVPDADETKFFQKFIIELNSSGIDRFPSFNLGLLFWKANYPEDYENSCPVMWKNISNARRPNLSF